MSQVRSRVLADAQDTIIESLHKGFMDTSPPSRGQGSGENYSRVLTLLFISHQRASFLSTGWVNLSTFSVDRIVVV
jgi:hypothetical protein